MADLTSLGPSGKSAMHTTTDINNSQGNGAHQDHASARPTCPLTPHFRHLLVEKSRYQPVLIDAAGITTNVRSSNAFTADPENTIKSLGLPLLEIKHGSKRRAGVLVSYLTIDLATYGGVRVYLEKLKGAYYIRTLDINPSKLLFGYNGIVLHTAELVVALTLVKDILAPLLADEADAIHLIPGLAPMGQHRAFWNRVELPMNIADPEERLLDFFKNSRHPSIRKRALGCEGESYKIGGRSTEMSINFYYKHIEMAKSLDKYNVWNSESVLRVEVTLKGKRLRELLGQSEGNCAAINGTSRLVRFRAADTVVAHHSVVSRLEGCFYHDKEAGSSNSKDKMGRFIARVTAMSGLSVDELIATYLEESGDTKNKKSRVRRSALERLSELSPITIGDFFAVSMYCDQPEIRIPPLDAICAARRDTQADPRISTAYSA